MKGDIFVSYRRDDSAYATGRLYDRLAARFGANRVFMDIDSIDLGVDFVRKIEDAVSDCDVVIAVMGKGWVGAEDAGGRRKLDDPHDFVRLELKAALDRDIHVIPALIDGAQMPNANDLPSDLAPLLRRNGLEIGHTRFDDDVGRLIKGLEAITSSEDRSTEPTDERPPELPKRPPELPQSAIQDAAAPLDEGSAAGIEPESEVSQETVVFEETVSTVLWFGKQQGTLKLSDQKLKFTNSKNDSSSFELTLEELRDVTWKYNSLWNEVTIQTKKGDKHKFGTANPEQLQRIRQAVERVAGS